MIEHTLLKVNCMLFAKHITWEYTDTFKLQSYPEITAVILVLTLILMLCNETVSKWILLLFPSPDSVILQLEDHLFM